MAVSMNTSPASAAASSSSACGTSPSRTIRRVVSQPSAKACALGLGRPASAAASSPRRRVVSAPARIPRCVPRIVGKSVDYPALDALCPDVPVAYVSNYLLEKGAEYVAFPSLILIDYHTYNPFPHSLYRTCQSVSATIPPNVLPKELEIIIENPLADLPTHMLAVQAPATCHGAVSRVKLYPVHDLLLATSCPNLPSLPALTKPCTPTLLSTPCPSEDAGFEACSPTAVQTTVPVVPITLPCPGLFPHLLAFLYTRQPEPLVKTLFRCSRNTNDPRLALKYLVHGVWQNAVALGVSDERLYHALDMTLAVAKA
jgi:hypothetical protein